MSNKHIALLFGLLLAALNSLQGQCMIDAYVLKGTYRSGGNSMRGYAFAFGENQIGAWAATVYGTYYFHPAGGSPSIIASGSQTGWIYSSIPDYPYNPNWQHTASLEPRGEGSYYTVGAAEFASECGDWGVVYPVASPSHPVYRPAITNLPYTNHVWYFGPGTADAIPSSGADYYQYADLTLDKKCFPEDNCSVSPTWTKQGDFISLNCPYGGDTCVSPKLRSTALGNCQYDNSVQASLGGFKSNAEAIMVNSPTVLVKPDGVSDYTLPWGSGYLTLVHWVVGDACRPQMWAMLSLPLNEVFGQFDNSGVISGWPDPLPSSSAFFTDGDPYIWSDKIGTWVSGYNPPAQNPPPRQQQPGGYSTQLVKFGPQSWFVGSETFGVGIRVYSGTISYYVDHGNSQ